MLARIPACCQAMITKLKCTDAYNQANYGIIILPRYSKKKDGRNLESKHV
jgi:hypothetical protein